MPAKKLKEFLEKEHVSYSTVLHPLAYTAQDVAAAAHISGKEVAKTVVVEIDGRLAMVVLPANRKIILAELREVTGCDRVNLVSEEDFGLLFRDCEIGAMPPFGNLYGMDVYVAPDLAEDEEIAFNAGSHTELIKMAYRDFERLVHPKVISFTT